MAPEERPQDGSPAYGALQGAVSCKEYVEFVSCWAYGALQGTVSCK